MLDKFQPPHPLNTAVLFLVFNRLNTTKQVFEAIKEAKPPRLYIAADGARELKDGEEEKVKSVREYIMTNIDWECEIKTLFRETNFGCKIAVSSAIDWFFENEEMGIILEDDCLPSQSFFWFCEELLIRYKNTEQVGAISGDLRGLDIDLVNKDSYDFCTYFSMWGWATWGRVWKKYDVNIFSSPNSIDKIDAVLNNMRFQKNTLLFWKKQFEKVQKNKIDTWDYQFISLLFSHKYKTVIPAVNLISNIGFDEEATHTRNQYAYQANVPRSDIDFPLILTKEILVNKNIDKWYENNEYKKLSFTDKVYRKLKKLFYTGLRK